MEERIPLEDPADKQVFHDISKGNKMLEEMGNKLKSYFGANQNIEQLPPSSYSKPVEFSSRYTTTFEQPDKKYSTPGFKSHRFNEKVQERRDSNTAAYSIPKTEQKYFTGISSNNNKEQPDAKVQLRTILGARSYEDSAKKTILNRNLKKQGLNWF